MKLCTTCSRQYEARHSFCGLDGTRLSWVNDSGQVAAPAARPSVCAPRTAALDIHDTQPMFPVKHLPEPAASARR
jgi:hypothetical protein